MSPPHSPPPSHPFTTGAKHKHFPEPWPTAWPEGAPFQHLGLARGLRPALAPSAPCHWGSWEPAPCLSWCHGAACQLWRQPVPSKPHHLALGPFCLLWAKIARQKQFPSRRLPLAGITALPYPSKHLAQCSGLTVLPGVWGPLSLSDTERALPAWVFLHFCLQKGLGPGDFRD